MTGNSFSSSFKQNLGAFFPTFFSQIRSQKNSETETMEVRFQLSSTGLKLDHLKNMANFVRFCLEITRYFQSILFQKSISKFCSPDPTTKSEGL